MNECLTLPLYAPGCKRAALFIIIKNLAGGGGGVQMPSDSKMDF